MFPLFWLAKCNWKWWEKLFSICLGMVVGMWSPLCRFALISQRTKSGHQQLVQLECSRRIQDMHLKTWTWEVMACITPMGLDSVVSRGPIDKACGLLLYFHSLSTGTLFTMMKLFTPLQLVCYFYIRVFPSSHIVCTYNGWKVSGLLHQESALILLHKSHYQSPSIDWYFQKRGLDSPNSDDMILIKGLILKNRFSFLST